MKKDDIIVYLAVLVLLFDFVSPIYGKVKFVIALVLVAAIFITAISRIVKGVSKKEQSPQSNV